MVFRYNHLRRPQAHQSDFQFQPMLSGTKLARHFVASTQTRMIRHLVLASSHQ